MITVFFLKCLKAYLLVTLSLLSPSSCSDNIRGTWLNGSLGLIEPFVPDKWNESGFRPPLCTYRLNWARRTSWGWWDDWDDTVLQTQDSKFEPWRSEAEHATSRSRRLPTILTFTRGWGRNNFVSFKPPRPGTEPRTLAWKAAVLTTTLGPPPLCQTLGGMRFRGHVLLPGEMWNIKAFLLNFTAFRTQFRFSRPSKLLFCDPRGHYTPPPPVYNLALYFRHTLNNLFRLCFYCVSQS